jgi:hypothetical protein
MKKILKTVLIAICALSIQDVFAQRLLVDYDFLNDDFTYYEVSKNGTKKEISRAMVTRNYNVKIVVSNYNPFVYTAVASYSTTEIQDAPNLNFLSMISPLGLPTGGSSFLNSITTGSETSRGGLFSDPKASQALEKVQEAYMTLYQAEQMTNNIDFVMQKVNKLKYNPYLPTDSIKSFTHELVSSLFGQSTVETQDFLAVANQINSTVNSDVAKLNGYVQNFESAYQKYATTRGSAGGFEGEGYDKMVQNWGSQAIQFANSFDSKILLEKLDYLEIEYQSIMNTPFHFNTSDIAKGDEIVVTIDFYKNPENTDGSFTAASISDISNLTKVKTKEVDVTVKGDLKINSSIGMAFPYYKDNAEFINKDSLITRTDGNNFTPNIAAYINFYPYTGKNATIGGTFGVGVPISADTKNFNFLLGGSTIFGSDNKLVLNFGATLGQVNKLDQGFVEGDNLGDVLTEVPTKKAYQWGAFIGISFALADIGN